MSFSMVAAERRRSRRVRVSTVVATMNGQPTAMGKGCDISMHGMFVEFQLSDPSREYRIGDVMLLRFNVFIHGDPIDARVVIRRVQTTPEGNVRGIGFEFVEIEDQGWSMIERYIEGWSGNRVYVAGVSFVDP
jgi:hypothetical protein